jgi:putative PEP-CTERM system histidine kinase
VGIFVSRQIVFYTATVFAAGLYLTIVGVLGYYIRSIEDSWGSAAQVIFSFAAVVGLFAFLFSERIRARSRVFINKHFYQNRYDYREEWLRLIETLTSVEEILPLKKRAIKALAMIVNAPSGILWLRSDDDLTLEAVSNWNTRLSVGQINVDDSLPTFLQRSGWVVEIGEYLADPSHYDDLELDARMLGLESPAVIVPLYTDLSLLGFVVLSEPATRLRLNYEDHDLLKTAGKQVASYLAQERATDQLAEGRQFEALNKLTAYIMHDLKNVIAQQSLVVENAQKHKDNPAFIEDAIETIRGGVKRMRRILEELQQGSATNPKQRIDLAALIMKVVSQCEDRDPAPRLTPPPDSVWVRADPERLHMAFYHAIRNAQEATPADGSVTIEFESDGERAGIRVIDTGCGMSRRFVRERLFRPFDSTKGTQGMGIGAYQIRETFRAVGGNIEIDSKESVGTTITMLLPVVAAPDYTAGKNVAAP